MNDLDNLASIWQSKGVNTHKEIYPSTGNEKYGVIDTIIHFENQEKREKRNQIIAAFFLLALTILLVYQITIDTLHLIGFILLIAGVSLNIIANKTDDFPDIRLLNTLNYLVAMKENTMARSGRHIRNTLIGLLFLIPGYYLTFRNSFTEIGYWWIVIATISGGYTLYIWFDKYNKRSKELLKEIDVVLKEFDPFNNKI